MHTAWPRRAALSSVVLVLVASTLAWAQVPIGPTPPEPMPSPVEAPSGPDAADVVHSDDPAHFCGHLHHWVALAREGRTEPLAGVGPQLGMAPNPTDPNTFTDVQHYHLQITVNPLIRWIGGSNVMTVRSQVDFLSSFVFELDSVLTLQRVEFNGTVASWQRLNSRQVRVTLPRHVHLDEIFTIRVEYDGVPTSYGFGSIFFNITGTLPIVHTLSQPNNAYSWWPTKDTLWDKAAMDIWITVPEWAVAASNGVLEGIDDIQGTDRRYRWRTSYPMIPYLAAFAAAPYTRTIGTWTYGDVTMPVELYTYSMGSNSINDSLNTVRTMLTRYSNVYGLYPFFEEKYGVARTTGGVYMEHQTISFQPSLSSQVEAIAAHELAHHWWGDLVTCATWSDLWLNEGFARYSEAVWFEFKGATASHEALINRLNQVKPQFSTGTVYQYSTASPLSAFNSLVYNKGGWVLHMLRGVVGSETFFSILHEYRDRYAFTSATTADFQAVAEDVYGEPLDWFFDQWIYEPGFPSYRFRRRALTVDGKNYVEVYAEQTQNPNLVTVRMPIEIDVRASNQWTTRRVWNDAVTQHFLLPLTGPLQDILYDPRTWLLRDTLTASSSTAPVGPPRIVDAAPLPGASLRSTDLQQFRLVFQHPVAPRGDEFALHPAVGEPIPLDLLASGSANVVLLSAPRRLPPGDYELRVRDTLVSQAGLALDGELTCDAGACTLPSGNGQPGGDAILPLTLLP